MVCLGQERNLLLHDLCLYQISSVAFSADGRIWEMEDREQGKDHVN